MSFWPSVADYKEAIQNPSFCFANSDLQKGEPAMNARRGSPLLWEGNFAVVFKLQSAITKDTWAIKCFHRKIDGLQFRYRAISDHLHKKKAALPFTVEFDFIERGIKVKGEWFPIVKMRWVDGTPLNDFVEKNVGNPTLLNKIADLMIAMEKQLTRAEVGHGDLQHGNILIVEKAEGVASLKLVDYDGMFVPMLATSPPSEKGHPNFQHKDRLKYGTYGREIDRFPFLVIYCALCSIAEHGRPLWDEYDNGDNLLFKEADFGRPSDSRLLSELWNRPDSGLKTRSITGKLILASNDSIENVPLLEELLDSNKQTRLTLEESDRINQILGVSGTNVGGSNSDEAVEIICPHCIRPVRIKIGNAGKVTNCPKCAKLIIVPAVTSDPSQPGDVTRTFDAHQGRIADRLNQGMRQPKLNECFGIFCPNCNSRFTTKVSITGKGISCPKCDWRFWVPSSAGSDFEK
jgi:DNA-directed RNA polymerase subunit RPC12/RpoP